jgi:acyl carrier protein
MSDLDSRLEAVFGAVFPGVESSALAGATREAVAAWDSVAAVTLATLIEEEFGLEFDDAGEWTSFQQVRRAVEEHLRE